MSLKKAIKYGVFYPLQFVGAALMTTIFFLLPLRFASLVGGRLTRAIGPLLGVSRTARRNLANAFPDWSADQIEKTVKGMWENLGRTIGEYPSLRKLSLFSPTSPVEVVGQEIIEGLKTDGKPALLFLGHLANWEYATLPALQLGLPLSQVFRPLNNPLIAWFIEKVHGSIAADVVTKGPQGARKMLGLMKNGGNLSMLVDQKLREGILVPFFGRPAKTPQAIANLALKFDCPIIPVRVERLHDIHCRVTYYPPLVLPQEGTAQEKVYAIMETVNATLETWIRDRPEQWLWVHNRWPSKE